jgi:cation-transporting ATPase E
VPTGIIAAVSTFVCAAIVRQLVPQADAQSIVTVALWIVAFWILCVLSRPLDRWRAILLGSMVLAFVLAITVPFGRDFFSMHVELGFPLLLGVACGVAGAIGIELMYRYARSHELIYDRV